MGSPHGYCRDTLEKPENRAHATRVAYAPCARVCMGNVNGYRYAVFRVGLESSLRTNTYNIAK